MFKRFSFIKSRATVKTTREKVIFINKKRHSSRKNALKKILIRTPFLILKKSKNIEKFFNSRKKLFKIKIAIQISHPKHNKSVTQNTTNQSPKTQQICPIFIYY